MAPDTYTLDVDADEAALVMEYRARKNAPPKTEPKAKAELKQQKASPFWVAVLIVIVLMIVAWFGLNFAAAFNLFVPPGWQQHAQAAPLPTAEVRIPAAPVTRQQPFSAPVAAQPVSVYPDTVAPYQQGAWTPAGPFDLDVAGRRYRALGQQGGAVYAELDDGTRVWLGTEPAPQPAVVEAAPAAQPTAPPIGAPDTWGSGGTTGGSTWGEPTALPLQNAIIPAMPAIEPPTPTWGEGGSTGGSTW